MFAKSLAAPAYALAIFGLLVQSIAYGLGGDQPAIVWTGPFVVGGILAVAWLFGAAGGLMPGAMRIAAGVAWAIAALGISIYDFEAAMGFPKAGEVIGHLSLAALAAIATDGMIVAAGGVWQRATLVRALVSGLVPLVLLFVTLQGAVVHLALTAFVPEARPPRLVSLLSTLAKLRDRYPHWRASPVTFAQLVDRHRDRFHAAVAGCPDDKPCPAIVEVLRDALAELNNGHVYVEWPESWVGPDVAIRLIEDRVAVVWTSEDQIEAGDIVESVDGLSIDAAIARLPHWATSGISARTRRHDAHRLILIGKERTSVDLVLRRADDTVYKARVERHAAEGEDEDDSRYDGTSDETDSDPSHDSESIEEEIEGAPLSGWTFPGHFTVINLEVFEQPEIFVARLDELARAINHEHGTIVDLRRCRGGQIDLLQIFLSRFARRSAVVGNRCVPDPTRDAPERISCSPLAIEPKGPRVFGPVAVLTGPETASAAEIAAHFLCSSGRARCFGETTAGETDFAEGVEVEGALVMMSIAGFEPLDGESLLGRGVVPDETVVTTLHDVRTGNDPVFHAARAWLGTK